MRLRTQLLLLALAMLVLPWAGWQFARGLEVRLREGQASALGSTASALARMLSAERPALPPPGPGFYVHTLAQPVNLDGDRSEWAAAWPDALRFGIADQPSLAVMLGQYGGSLHLFLEVAQATGDKNTRPSMRLVVDNGDRVRVLRLSVDDNGLVVHEDDKETAIALYGQWQSRAGGYAVELRLPPQLLPRRLGLEAAMTGEDGKPLLLGTEPDRLDGLWPLFGVDARLQARLAALTPTGLRLRLTHPQGWLLAEAGAFEALPVVPSVWGRMLARALADGNDTVSAEETGRRRLTSPELDRALHNQPANGWHRPESGPELRLVAMAPVVIDGRVRAVLEVARRSEATVLAQQALSGLLTTSLLAMLAVASVLLAYASWLSWRIRRLGRLVDAAREREPGTRVTFVSSRARDEIGELSRRFERLLEEVEGYTDYLRTLAGKLSHELNTPLAIVRSSLENLGATSDAKEAVTYVQRACAGTERLLAIVRAMSEATRVERAIACAEGENVDLRAVIAGCAEGYRPLLTPRRFDVLLPSGPLPFYAAPELLAQALDKLVENARSFCPEDGWIAIALSSHGEGVNLMVANAGPPLPDIGEARLFDSLVSVRATGQRSDGTPHLGLGLHIVRLIVELHGGSVHARNLPGGGVEFRLHLRGMPRR